VGYQRARDPFTPALPRRVLRGQRIGELSNEPVHTWDGLPRSEQFGVIEPLYFA
jgi:hypothetical protein